MNGSSVLRQDVDGLCTLTLNRGDKLNALDTAAFEALESHLASLEGQLEQIGCVVLRGAGRGFCAGADLAALGSASERPPTYKPQVIERLSRLPLPVIAAVHGVCFTGGLELALACDFIVADGTARFADTHGKWGLVGAWGMTPRLPRRIGMPAAKRMMFTSRECNASEAHQLGLVDLLCAPGGLDDLLRGLVADILANSRFTNRATKRLLTETDGMSLAQGLAHEQYRYPGWAPDHAERVAAFRRRSSAPKKD
jgi:enoyl-CoA hydratase/carnithine racemase